MTRTFVTDVEDVPGVLNRVASLFRRRAYNIESLTVSRTERPGVSRMTIVMNADDDTAKRVEANLYKLVNVLYVQDLAARASVVREMALIKVRADAATRAELLQHTEDAGARVIDVSETSLTMEMAGTQQGLDRFIAALTPYGLIELLRTGAVAMARGAAPVAAPLPSSTDRSPEET